MNNETVIFLEILLVLEKTIRVVLKILLAFFDFISKELSALWESNLGGNPSAKSQSRLMANF